MQAGFEQSAFLFGSIEFRCNEGGINLEFSSKGASRMKLMMKIFSIILAVSLLSGCAKVVIKADSDPNFDFKELNTFYVQKFSPDKRGLEQIIADKLTTFGYQATSGINALPHHPVDALVTYKDQWMWDLTNYMLEIKIEFREPETKFLFATGQSYRTSLARKSPEEMIDEALREMFAGKVDIAQ